MPQPQFLLGTTGLPISPIVVATASSNEQLYYNLLAWCSAEGGTIEFKANNFLRFFYSVTLKLPYGPSFWESQHTTIGQELARLCLHIATAQAEATVANTLKAVTAIVPKDFKYLELVGLFEWCATHDITLKFEGTASQKNPYCVRAEIPNATEPTKSDVIMSRWFCGPEYVLDAIVQVLEIAKGTVSNEPTPQKPLEATLRAILAQVYNWGIIDHYEATGYTIARDTGLVIPVDAFQVLRDREYLEPVKVGSSKEWGITAKGREEIETNGN